MVTPPLRLGLLSVVPRADPYRLELEDFAAAVRGEREPLLGRDDALGQARSSGLATLVSADENHPAATLAPFISSREESGRRRVWGHLARANPQSQAVLAEREVLVIFRGPDAYVSPSWYGDAPNVPTWNFVVVHADGVARPVALGDPRTRWILERTVAKYESRLPQSWRLDEAPDSYVEQLLPHVVAFELEVSTLRGQFKLSQNQPRENRLGVIQGLQQRPDDGSREIAGLMAALEPRTPP